MTGTAHMEVEADVARLYDVMDFVAGCIGDRDVPARTASQLELVIEEVFVNIASYAYAPGTGTVRVSCAVSDDGVLTLVFEDAGEEFDPLAAPDPDVGAPMEERRVGGLGIYLVKRNVDGISYSRIDGRNVLTIRKSLS